MVAINEQAPEFQAKAYHEGQFKEVDLKDYKGKWIVLFFYPADFTFVCPTELEELAEKHDKFRELGVELFSVSTDTEFVHKAWHDHSDAIGKVQYPMVADPTGLISKAYGTYIHEEGVSLRGTFVIDPDGKVKLMEVHDNDIGRSADELLRKIQAAQYVRNHGGEVCPANWRPGGETLKPGEDLVGKI